MARRCCACLSRFQMTSYNRILVDAGPASTRITLNRPDKRNAIDALLLAELKQALAEARDARVIVLTGAGKDFCSGADLSALHKIRDAGVLENMDDARNLADLFTAMRRHPRPIVAAVRGRALAGGCGLASACDLIVAAESAQFGYPEVNIGFVPAMVMAILRRNVSEKRAFELITRGSEIGAEAAKQFGLVNQVFSDEDFETEVTTYVRGFEKMSKSAVALTKKLLYQIDGMSFGDALETGVDVNVIARLTEDCQKGIAQFLKKN